MQMNLLESKISGGAAAQAAAGAGASFFANAVALGAFLCLGGGAVGGVQPSVPASYVSANRWRARLRPSLQQPPNSHSG